MLQRRWPVVIAVVVAVAGSVAIPAVLLLRDDDPPSTPRDRRPRGPGLAIVAPRGAADITRSWRDALLPLLADDISASRRPLARVSRCNVELDPPEVGAAEVAALRFRRRNDGDWRVATLDGVVLSVKPTRPPDEPTAVIDRPAAIETAAAFVAANHDLFGIDRDDLATGAAQLAPGPTLPEYGRWTQYDLDIRGERVDPADRSMKRVWFAQIVVGMDGQILRATGRTIDAPVVDACPTDHVGEAAAIERALGVALRYSTIVGQPADMGVAVRAGFKSIAESQDPYTKRPTYMIVIGEFTILVDVETGDVVGEGPNFRS